jgi:hypothetical protein
MQPANSGGDARPQSRRLIVANVSHRSSAQPRSVRTNLEMDHWSAGNRVLLRVAWATSQQWLSGIWVMCLPCSKRLLLLTVRVFSQ